MTETVDKKTADGLTNFMARLGLQADNLNRHAFYSFDMLTKNRVQLEAMYRGSWIAGAAVDAIAEDMTRAGIQIRGDENPEAVAQMQAAFSRLGVWDALLSLLKWGRLYGGALAFIVIDGQDAATPLEYDTVGRGQFGGLRVYDRWQLAPDLQRIVHGGADDGLPEYYDVLTGARLRIHHSRVIRATGITLPYEQALVEELWGESVLERVHDALVAFDSASAGASNLMHKAHLRMVGIEGLYQILAAGGQPEENLLKRFHLMRHLQSNEGITLLDKQDEYQAHSYTFSGIPDIILQFGQQIAGALGIPLVRLFGQSPAGLSATGESDIRMYYDNIAALQEARLRRGVDKLLRVMYRSLFGEAAPAAMDFDFTPLWQMSARDKAEIAKVRAETAVHAYEAGLLDTAAAMRELRAAAETTGIFTSITSEAIEQAEMEPPPAGEIEPQAGDAEAEGMDTPAGEENPADAPAEGENGGLRA